MITSEYNPELDIFIEIYTDNITINDLLSYYSSTAEKMDLPKELNILVDLREVSFQFNAKDLFSVAVVVKQKLSKYKFVNVRAALLHFKPYEQALTMVFQKIIGHIDNLECNIFTSEKHALHWLQESKD